MKLPLRKNKNILVIFFLLASVFLNKGFAQDADNDGIPDAEDNCPFLSNVTGASQQAFLSNVQPGTLAYGDRLGARFTMGNAILVTELGAFDDNLDGFNSTIMVAIVDVFGNPVVGPVSFNGSAGYSTSSQYRFQSLTVPVLLPPNEYFLVAVGYNSIEKAGEGPISAINDGNISFSYPMSGGSGIGKPLNVDVNYAHAGNFRYNPVTLQFPDNDHDGSGDPCDEDDDNDGILDVDDPCPFTPGTGGGSTIVVLVQDEAHFHRDNIDGDVGVWQPGKIAKIHDFTIVNGSVTASVIDIDNNSQVIGSTNYTPAAPPSTPFVFNTTPDPLSDITVPDNYPGIYQLYGSSFRKITVGKNSTLKFMATGNITMKELVTKDANTGSNTTLLFSGNTNLLVRRKVDFGKRASVNYLGEPKVVIYVEQDDVHVGQSSMVSANIDVRFANLVVEEGVEDIHTEMRGSFIAKKLDSKKWVHWYGGGGCGIGIQLRGGNVTYSEAKRVLLPYVEQLGASVYPNPSATEFTININAPGDQPVTVRITDILGQTIKYLSTEAKTKTIIAGADLKAGIYFAEIKQGTTRQVVKLIKMQ